LASPISVSSMPGASQAPKDWPAEPRNSSLIVPSGSPSAPHTCVIALERMPPTVRLTLRTLKAPVTGRRWSTASWQWAISS
jgi:hypothetical protein